LSPFESLIAVAQGEGEVFELARAMIGKAELALLIAKAAVANTTGNLSPTNVAKILEMSESGARKKIDNSAVRAGGAS
jgi:hypothetical protein